MLQATEAAVMKTYLDHDEAVGTKAFIPAKLLYRRDAYPWGE